MRLTSKDRGIIKSVILDILDGAEIILFGSRLIDDKRGGDIDLLVRTRSAISLNQKIKILGQLELKGIKRKVDLLVQTPETPHQSIISQALKNGVVL